MAQIPWPCAKPIKPLQMHYLIPSQYSTYFLEHRKPPSIWWTSYAQTNNESHIFFFIILVKSIISGRELAWLISTTLKKTPLHKH